MDVRTCDETEWSVGWIVADEFMERCSHALRDGDGRVWVIDPVADEGAEARIRGLGEPAGVIQLLDRHNRDCAELAGRLGVTHHRVPFEGVPGSPFETIPVRRRRRWKEVALWWAERRVLVCADALGTASYYRAGNEPLAVNPLMRFFPPTALAQIEPETILVGHGEGLREGAAEAMQEALSSPWRRLPKLAVSLAGGRARRRSR